MARDHFQIENKRKKGMEFITNDFHIIFWFMLVMKQMTAFDKPESSISNSTTSLSQPLLGKCLSRPSYNKHTQRNLPVKLLKVI